MKVRLKTSMSGDDGAFKPGDVVDLEKAYAVRMIESGQAEPVEQKTKRTATKKGGEKAAKN